MGFILVEIDMVLLQVFTDTAADVSLSENAIVNSFPINSLLPVQPIVVHKLLGLFLYYVVQLIYTTSQTKFERNSPSSLLVSRT